MILKCCLGSFILGPFSGYMCFSVCCLKFKLDRILAMNWWTSLFFFLCKKTFLHIYFLFFFSSALGSCVSIHVKPPSVPTSQSPAVNLWLPAAWQPSKLILFFPNVCFLTVGADPQVCTATQTPALSLCVTFSIFLCQMQIHPSLSQFLCWCFSLCLSHFLSLTSQEASNADTAVFFFC